MQEWYYFIRGVPSSLWELHILGLCEENKYCMVTMWIIFFLSTLITINFFHSKNGNVQKVGIVYTSFFVPYIDYLPHPLNCSY